MRDFSYIALAIGSVCLLIPYPGLWWVTGLVLAALWFVTPSWQQETRRSRR